MLLYYCDYFVINDLLVIFSISRLLLDSFFIMLFRQKSHLYLSFSFFFFVRGLFFSGSIHCFVCGKWPPPTREGVRSVDVTRGETPLEAKRTYDNVK